MQPKKIIISVAPTTLPQFTEATAKFKLGDETVQSIAKEFSMLVFGYTPFVFASFPPNTDKKKIQERMLELWKKHRS